LARGVPITIESPVIAPAPGNQLIGWGTLVRAHTDFIGPFPSDTSWGIQVWRDDQPERWAVNQLYQFVQGQPLNRYIGEPGERDPADLGQGFLTIGGRQNTPMTLRVNLDTPSTGFHEEARVQAPWDEITQMPNLLSVLGATTGGFTATDRTTLEATNNAVLKGFPGLPDFPITELLLHPPLGVLRTELITPDRTGSGFLERTDQIAAARTYGVLIDIVGNGPGMGIEFGTPNELLGPSVSHNAKAVQLGVVHTLNDGQVIYSDQVVMTQGRQMYLFKINLPTRIDYYIVPTVTIRFHWIVAGVA
jgi:hypothetical protein